MNTRNDGGHPPTLVVSLDFELYWGVRDRRSMAEYRENLDGVRQAIPALLRLFREYRIRATWATVGLLFFQDRSALLAGIPEVRPSYRDTKLDAYAEIQHLGNNEPDDPFRFGQSLISEIAACSGQEIATHTFSHYYCCEPGQNAESFRADLNAALRAAAAMNITLRSIVFPRNQINPQYLSICSELGIRAYRGNPAIPIYAAARAASYESAWKRSARLADAFFPLTGSRSYRPSSPAPGQPINIPASMFLRPFSPALRSLLPFQIRRINDGLVRAARRREIYHLWWHPHNFGRFLPRNLAMLTQILEKFDRLRSTHGMVSAGMADVSQRYSREGCAAAAHD